MNEARYTVEKAAAQDIETDEPGDRRRDEPNRGKTLAPRKQPLGLQRRIPILLGEIGLERFARGVQQVAGETPHLALGANAFVYQVIAPSCVAAIEKPKIPIRITLAVREPSTEKAVSPRHRIRVELRAPKRRPNRGRQLGSETLIGV